MITRLENLISGVLRLLRGIDLLGYNTSDCFTYARNDEFGLFCFIGNSIRESLYIIQVEQEMNKKAPIIPDYRKCGSCS